MRSGPAIHRRDEMLRVRYDNFYSARPDKVNRRFYLRLHASFKEMTLGKKPGSLRDIDPLDFARVTVLDQIPVSQHPDIKVKLREATPKPAGQNEQGELTWQLELKKGDKAQIDFAVTVEYPKETRVVGL